MATRFCGFPQEILEEILSWLPPESLMRFKCVCKSWYALMKNPLFVDKHLHNIDKRIFSSTTCLVYSTYSTFGTGYFCSSITISNDDCENDQLEHVSKDFEMPGILSGPNIRGCHCNGIICFAEYDGTVMLCNPAINEYRALPEPCLGKDVCTIVGVGFGYDSRANDYKVVKLGADDRVAPDMLEHLVAEVYSFESDSWREIDIDVQLDGLPAVDRAVLCKGGFYWSIWARNDYLIVSFDLFDEVFHRLPLPDNLHAWPWKKNKLDVWNDSIALFSHPLERGTPFLVQVWVLDDCFGGVKGSYSWIKKLTIGPLDGIMSAWTFWKDDEFLMVAVGGGLVSYNLRSQMFRNLSIQGAESRRFWEFYFSYVKSLVSVKGGNQAHW